MDANNTRLQESKIQHGDVYAQYTIQRAMSIGNELAVGSREYGNLKLDPMAVSPEPKLPCVFVAASELAFVDVILIPWLNKLKLAAAFTRFCSCLHVFTTRQLGV